MDKKKAISLLIAQQDLAITELSKTMQRYRSDADIDEDATKEPQDFSNQTVSKEAELRVTQQIKRAEEDRETLMRFAEESYDSVQSGALIETDKQLFLAGIALGGFDSSVIDVLCISADSPAYEMVAGKKAGDSFTLGEKEFKIKNVS